MRHLSAILFASTLLSACSNGVVHQIDEGSVAACSNPAVRREFIAQHTKLGDGVDPGEARIYNDDLAKLRLDFSETRVLSFDQDTKTLTCQARVTERLGAKEGAYETMFSLQQDGDHLNSFILGYPGGTNTTSPLIAQDIPPKLIALHNANPSAYPDLKPIPACPYVDPNDPYYHPAPCGPVDTADANDPTFDHSKGDRRPPTPPHRSHCRYMKDGDQFDSLSHDPACLSSGAASTSPSTASEDADVIPEPNGARPPASLLQAWGKNEEACRGSDTPDAPTTQATCKMRDNAYQQLNDLGWCHGREGDAEADEKWQRCVPGTNGYKDPPARANQ